MKEEFLINKMNKYEEGVFFCKAYTGRIDKLI